MGSVDDESHGINLKSIQTIIFFSLLFSQSIASDDEMMVSSICLSPNQTETINNQTIDTDTDDGFQTNLSYLLNNLIPTSAFNASLSFYKAAVAIGKSSEKAYGIYLCRGDATSRLCQSCVNNLTQFLITTMTPGCKEQFAYADYCMTRYANYSFFGRVDKTLLGPMYENLFTTYHDAYNRTLDGVFEKVISDAAYNSTTSFATSEGNLNGVEKVYALAQCTPDITKRDCYDCLKTAYAYVQQPLDINRDILVGAWYMLASCQLKFNNATFYLLSTAVPSNSPPIFSAFLIIIVQYLLLF